MYGLPTLSVGVSSIAKGTPPLLTNFRPLSSNGIFFSSLKSWSLAKPVSYLPLTSFIGELFVLVCLSSHRELQDCVSS